MKILITGGNGLIGSNLLTDLPKDHNIISLSRGTKHSELQKLVKDNVKLINGNVSDEEVLDKIIPGTDIIMHFAGGGGNNACMNNPSEAVDVYIKGTQALLKKAKENQVRLFIFASSHFAYSTFKEKPLPLTENETLEPDDLYGSLKAAAEKLIQDSGITYLILRFTNIYGYGNGLYANETGGAIENFIAATKENKDITIYGEGEQKIDYLNVKDVVECIKVLINSNIKNEIFNIATSHPHSIKELAELISKLGEEVYRTKSNIQKTPAPEGKSWPDKIMSIEKIKTKLNWQPSISLEKGIKELMEAKK